MVTERCLRKVLTCTSFGCVVFLSCVEYMPKPHGYFRIEPEMTVYKPIALTDRPYQFNISQAVQLELPLRGENATWMNIAYPELNAKIYCAYSRITSRSLCQAMEESRLLISRQLIQGESALEKIYSNPGNRVYGSLFLLEGGSASPIQFFLTDSVSHFFRGGLYFDCKPNADSLAPAVQYVREDIIEIIQSFNWK